MATSSRKTLGSGQPREDGELSVESGRTAGLGGGGQQELRQGQGGGMVHSGKGTSSHILWELPQCWDPVALHR